MIGKRMGGGGGIEKGGGAEERLTEGFEGEGGREREGGRNRRWKSREGWRERIREVGEGGGGEETHNHCL